MIHFRNIIEQSILMRYYTFLRSNVWSALPEWIQKFDDSIHTTYAKIDKYTPCDWRIYNKGKDSSYTDGYSNGLLERHDNDWDKAKEHCHKLFQRESREAKEQSNADGANNEYSEDIVEEYCHGAGKYNDIWE